MRVNEEPPFIVSTTLVHVCAPHGAVPSSHQLNTVIAVNDAGWNPAGTAPTVV